MRIPFQTSIVFVLLALTSLLSGCATSEDNPGPDWTPGIYTGSFTPDGGAAQAVIVMVTSDMRVLYAETDVETAGLGTASGDTVNFGSQASMSLSEGLTGRYQFGAVAGSFTLTASDVYDRASSTANLDGLYDDDIYTSLTPIGDTTWDFTGSSNGSFDMTSASGCTAYGNIRPIDTDFNEYAVNMTLELCGDYTGVYTGLAFTDDTNANATNDSINILVENAARDRLVFSAPVLR